MRLDGSHGTPRRPNKLLILVKLRQHGLADCRTLIDKNVAFGIDGDPATEDAYSIRAGSGNGFSSNVNPGFGDLRPECVLRECRHGVVPGQPRLGWPSRAPGFP